MYEKLTNIPIELTRTEDVIKYLLNNHFIGIVNDLGNFNMKYKLNELLNVWDALDIERCIYYQDRERVRV